MIIVGCGGCAIDALSLLLYKYEIDFRIIK